MTDIEEKNPLAAAAQEGGAEALEAMWLDFLEEPRPAGFFLEALEFLPEISRRASGGQLLQLLLETCQQREAHGDVLQIVRALVEYRPRGMSDLGEVARAALRKVHGDEKWFDLFERLADIDDLGLADGLARFDKLTRLLPGSVVYHRTGWGEGLVTGLDLGEESFAVRFKDEASERLMPFTTGLDVLQVLAPSDLRARLMNDVEGLRKDAGDDPAALVKAVARLHKDRATAKEIKQWLAGPVIEPSAWNSWWRKAKVAAARDPYLAVDNPSRPVFILRKRALSPEEEIEQAMSRAPDLAALLEVVRGPLSLDAAEELRQSMLERIESMLDGPATAEARTEAALLLARHERMPAAKAGEIIGELLDETRNFGELVAPLKPTSLRKEALEAFVASRPKLWSDAIIGDLAALPPGLVDAVAERLVAEGRGEALANRLSIFLLSPSRQPATVLRLAKRFAAGRFDGVEGAPSVADVFMGLLHLAETQAPRAAREDRPARDVLKGVTDIFLAKKGGLLDVYMQGATRTDMERVMGVLARCRTMPDAIASGIHAACDKRFPDLVPREETPFWESNNIFSSRDGLARRQEEYRVLLEEKIPENSETIGRAASYGDLSENYEWAAAIEQQRQLTEKAAAMEAELRLARTIEDQEHEAADVVQPGTRVRYRENGEEKTITILGPWDIGEGIISYRAPVAAGMLGARPGDTATLQLPEGDVEVSVLSVESVL